MKSGRKPGRAPEVRLRETVELVRAIDLEIVAAEVVNISKARSATLLGSGTVERFRLVIEGEEDSRGKAGGGHRISVVVIDGRLTPVQQRNLERAWNCKVIDRSGLILEIFGERARTREGSLQVELAALTYARSRLVRSWTHLERQRGGLGFVGGPGETQIETDRRLIGQRITRLRRQLKEVKRTRGLHRKARRRVPFPVVALVGYTNAGKSTLFNFLTKARVSTGNRLFETLDPTMRGLDLPKGGTIILSDTVGFISDLPHELVAAFQATLEEVLEADAVVHVRDAADRDSEAQKEDVLRVLREIGLGDAVEEGLIEVMNKTDLLSEEERETLANRARRANTPLVPLSALTGEGCDRLAELLEQRMADKRLVLEVSIASSDGPSLAWLYERGEVLERRDEDSQVRLKVRLEAADAARFKRRQGQVRDL